MVKSRLRQAWEYPGGHAEAGETPEQACRREVKEEVGLDLASYRLLNAFHYRRGFSRRVFYTFMAQTGPNPAVALQKFEISDYRWVTRNEALQLIAPRLKGRLTALFVTIDAK